MKDSNSFNKSIRNLLLCTALALLLCQTLSCSGKSRSSTENKQTADVSADAPVKTGPVQATVSGEMLRLRSLPYLDADILALMPKNTTVLVQHRTSWQQEIDGTSAPWYFIRTDMHTGWTYGGFLTFSAGEASGVRVDPYYESPDKRETVLSKTNFDHEAVPEILLPVSNTDTALLLSQGAAGRIVYSEEHNVLVLPLKTQDNLQFADADYLTLAAKAPDGREFKRNYFREEWSFYPENTSGVSKQKQAVLLPFYPTAQFRKGLWEFYVFLDDNNWPAAVGKAEIQPPRISLLPSSEPHPLESTPHSSYRRGAAVYCYGRSDIRGDFFQLVLYHKGAKNENNEILLSPVYSCSVKSDELGYWSKEIIIGQDWPSGRYIPAAGQPVSGLDNLYLGETSLQL